MLLSPDQRQALVTNVSQGFAIYDIASAQVLACSRSVSGLSKSSPAAFIHNGHAILIGCVDGQATLFDSENGQFIQSLTHEGVPIPLCGYRGDNFLQEAAMYLH